jgi:CheY-like chemotaxis protein/nitrogen-specific signal transduction histidine kinase
VFMSGFRGSDTAVLDAAGPTGWLDPADVASRQARLEDAALVARRLAHDFGNVLTGILGFSEISLGILSSHSPVYQYALEVQRSAQQGAELTQRLRWFSRRGAVGRETGDVAESIRGEEASLRPELDAAVKFQATVAASLPPVALDGETLKQVLRQVLDNAKEAVESGGTISLAARGIHLTDAECRRLLGAATPGPHVEIMIRDDGGGLSAEARQRLFFEPFYSDKPRHRGLGLAIVYGVLRNCRGGFRLDNAPGGGTLVRLVLPTAAATGCPALPATMMRTEGERILVVDDDPAVLHVVRATLERAGYRVQSAASGGEALARYAAAGPRGFELVLADAVMPQLSGLDLACCLLDQDAGANVLFMSGQVSADFVQCGRLQGRFDVLAKPFRPEGLLCAVRTALDRRTLAAPFANGSEPIPEPAT